MLSTTQSRAHGPPPLFDAIGGTRPDGFLDALKSHLLSCPADESLNLLSMRRMLPRGPLALESVLGSLLGAIRLPDGRYRHSSPLSPGARGLLFERAGKVLNAGVNQHLLGVRRIAISWEQTSTLAAEDLCDARGVRGAATEKSEDESSLLPSDYEGEHCTHTGATSAVTRRTGDTIGNCARIALAASQYPAATAQRLANELDRARSAAEKAGGQGPAASAMISNLIEELGLPSPSKGVVGVSTDALLQGAGPTSFGRVFVERGFDAGWDSSVQRLEAGASARDLDCDLVGLLNDVTIDGALTIEEAEALVREWSSYIQQSTRLVPVVKHTWIGGFAYEREKSEQFEEAIAHRKQSLSALRDALNVLADHPLRKEPGALSLLIQWCEDEQIRARDTRYDSGLPKQRQRLPELEKLGGAVTKRATPTCAEFDYTAEGAHLLPLAGLDGEAAEKRVSLLTAQAVKLKAVLMRSLKGVGGYSSEVVENRRTTFESDLEASSTESSSESTTRRTKKLFGALSSTRASLSHRSHGSSSAKGRARSYEYTGQTIRMTRALARFKGRKKLQLGVRFRQRIAPQLAQLDAIAQQLLELSTEQKLPEASRSFLDWAASTKIEAKVGDLALVDRYILEG